LFGRDGEEEVKTYDIVTSHNLQKVLDRRGCDAVQDPHSMAWVDFAAIELQDGMLLRARSDFHPTDLRVGFDPAKRGGGGVALELAIFVATVII
jgi:hypothetical protein